MFESNAETQAMERRGFTPEQIAMMQNEFSVPQAQPDGTVTRVPMSGKDTLRKAGGWLDAQKAEDERVAFEAKMRPHWEAEQREYDERQRVQAQMQHDADEQKWLADMQARAPYDENARGALEVHKQLKAADARGVQRVVADMGPILTKLISRLDIPSDAKTRLTAAPDYEHFDRELDKTSPDVRRKVERSLSEYFPAAAAQHHYQPRQDGGYY